MKIGPSNRIRVTIGSAHSSCKHWIATAVASLFLGIGLVAILLVPAEHAFAKVTAIVLAPSDRAPLACGPNWSVVISANGDPTHYNNLEDVAGTSSTDIWAVGEYDDGSVFQTLTEHWNGSVWSVIPSQNPATGPNRLLGVTAIASNDVWAVGYSGAGTLMEHWNGSTWSVIPSPSPGTDANELNGVTAIASNDVWAVGDYDSIGSYTSQTLVEHWDGSAWSIVPSPNVGTNDSVLNAAGAVSTDDAWAVGEYYDGSINRTLTEHWNGAAWSIVPSPNVGTASNVLNGVVAIASNDVWAVGDDGLPSQTLTEHWNGSAWTVVSSPSPGTDANALNGVTAIASNDVWAVGAFDSGSGGQTLVEHWNGSAWTVVSSPDPGTDESLDGVTAVASNDVWAVGYYDIPPNTARTLTERYNPCSVSPTPTLPPTRTPGVSSTPLPPTNTPTSTHTAAPTQTPGGPSATPGPPTATPTACTLQFSDVPPGSTFYPYIHCLACLGLINGYLDGTFKPNNNVTRGQLSKIVSNAAGFSDTPTGQQFQDVPPSGPGSTFYVYIFRLVSRGYISGYPCGGPNEPCIPPANLPYFRPNANATRGQISKIVSNAAGFADPPTGQQFQDVLVGSTYYTYTYRLVSRGVMSGYPCGSPPAGPCVPPANLPYFRPNNNATRGQTSKIVANTFFPDCAFLAFPFANR